MNIGSTTSGPDLPGNGSTASEERPTSSLRIRLRITYRKGGDLRFLSHLDLVRLFERLLRRSELPIEFSRGFNPRIRLSFSGALATGLESDHEELDVVLSESVAPEVVLARLRALAPQGIEWLEAAPASGPLRSEPGGIFEIRTGNGTPLSPAAREALEIAASELGSDLRFLPEDPARPQLASEGSVRVVVAAGTFRPSALLRALVAAAEISDPAGEPLILRKLAIRDAHSRELPLDVSTTDNEKLDAVQRRRIRDERGPSACEPSRMDTARGAPGDGAPGNRGTGERSDSAIPGRTSRRMDVERSRSGIERHDPPERSV